MGSLKINFKSILLLIVSLLIINNVLYAQSDDDKIKEIRNVFYSTEKNINDFEIKTFDLSDNSSQGGELEVFHLENKISKATITYYGELGKVTKDFYFRNDSLFFIFEVICNYNQPITLGDYHIESKEEYRYYIWNKSIIKYIDSDKKEFWNTEIPDFSNKIKVLLEESDIINLTF